MGRPRKYNSVEEFDLMVDLYVATCKEEKVPMTTVGLALHMGFCDKQSLYDYREFPEFTFAVKRALSFVESSHAGKVAAGVQGVAGPIFLLKACYNYKDTSTVELLPITVNIEGKDGQL